MTLTVQARPFLRWVGGKYKNIDRFAHYLPPGAKKCFYVEPFVGSGAMLFHLKPEKALISDINAHLINAYIVIRNRLDILIDELEEHDRNDKESYYYYIRNSFNDLAKKVYDEPDAVRAGYFIYLNTRCFNGLYRENADGRFNAPYAKDLKGLKRIYDEKLYQSIHEYLKGNDITILHSSFETIPDRIKNIEIKQKIFYFIDPPYHPIDETSNFASYVSGKWSEEMSMKLKDFADWIDSNGDLFYICNHAVDFIRDLFNDYIQHEHTVSRSVSCDAQNRKPVKEIVVTNYKISDLFSFT